MFDDHRHIGAHKVGEGRNIVNVSSPFHYSRRYIPDDLGEFLLMCDTNKYFSLIDSQFQSPEGGVVPENSYIKTDFKSGSCNAYASYIRPADSPTVGYIIQPILVTGSSTTYFAKCDLDTIYIDPNNNAALKTVTTGIPHSMSGHFGSFYPGQRDVVGDYQIGQLTTVGVPLLNTNTYSGINRFITDANTGAVPLLASYVGRYQIRVGTQLANRLYSTFSANSAFPSNSCLATNYNIYPGNSYTKYSRPTELPPASDASILAYSLCYPTSLLGNATPFLVELFKDPVNFLVNNGEYARPLCRGYQIYGMGTYFSYVYTAASFDIGPSALGVLLSYVPQKMDLYFTNYTVATDKTTVYSCGMYANTDMLFCDVLDIGVGALTAGFHFQVLRSRRGSLVIRYMPVSDHYINLDIAGADSPKLIESTDLFYVNNGANPEEYNYCDGFLYGKQYFKYSTFTKTSPSPVITNGAWSPGDQSTLLRAIRVTLEKGLIQHAFTAVPNPNNPGTLVWKFDDITINSLSQGIGSLNQVVLTFMDSNTVRTKMGPDRGFLSSCQAPYDTVFCDGEAVGIPVLIDNCLIMGLTSSQGILDDIYDGIVAQVSTVLITNTIGNAPIKTGSFTIPMHSIVLVNTDATALNEAAISFESVHLDHGVSGLDIAVTGMNPAARILAGTSFIQGGTTYKYILFSQILTIEYMYTFDVKLQPGDAIAAVFNDFPFGSCTSTFSSAQVSVNADSFLIPLIINKLVITGSTPTLLPIPSNAPPITPSSVLTNTGINSFVFNISAIPGLVLQDGNGLTFPKICTYNNYVFTHSAKYIIMLDNLGNELYRDQLACVKYQSAQHTYFDRFDILIKQGYGDYIIDAYFKSITPTTP